MSEPTRPKKKRKKGKKQQQAGAWIVPLCVGVGCLVVGLVVLVVSSQVKSKLASGLLILLGVAFLIVSAAVGISTVYGLLFPPAKLVFREDAVELVTQDKQVIGRIPFANVGQAQMAWFETGEGVGFYGLAITLYRPKDPETYWPCKVKDDDYDIVIPDDPSTPLTALQREFHDGMARHISRKTGGDVHMRDY